MRKWTVEYLKAICKPVGDCWVWSGCISRTGQPQASIEGRKGASVRRHSLRMAGRLTTESQAFVVITDCEEKRCCNPAHLKLVPKGVVSRQNANPRRKCLATLRNSAIAVGRAKLDMPKVREIRAAVDHLCGKERADKINQLAEQYGVGAKAIRKAAAGTSWVEPANSVFIWRPKEAA